MVVGCEEEEEEPEGLQGFWPSTWTCGDGDVRSSHVEILSRWADVQTWSSGERLGRDAHLGIGTQGRERKASTPRPEPGTSTRRSGR